MKIQEAGKFWLEYHKVNSKKKTQSGHMNGSCQNFAINTDKGT
ncbi:MAG: hypothetical protein ABIN18_23235 [Pseudomonadota bacterium]